MGIFDMIPGLKLGASSSRSRSNQNFASSGTGTSSGQSYSMPVVPEGWWNNYNALGANLGFGPTNSAPTPDISGGSNQAFGSTQIGMPQFNPSAGVTDQFGMPSFDYWTPPSQQPEAQPPTQAPVMQDQSQQQPAAALTGFLPGQQAGFDALQNQLTTQPWQPIISEGQNRIEQGARAMERVWNDTLAPMAGQANYQLGGNVQVAPVGDISAETAAQRMGAYANPWQRDVVDTTKADMDEAYNRIQNRNKMAMAAGGALGGGGQAVSSSLIADDYLRGLGSTLSNIRSRGFEVGANLGMGDANRALSAAQANQANQRAIALANAQLQDSRDKFNVNANLQSDAARRAVAGMGMDAAAAAAQLGAASADLGLTGVNNQTQAAMNLFNAGQIGFDQLMAFLTGGTATFGQQNAANEQTTENTTGSTTTNASGRNISIGVGGAG